MFGVFSALIVTCETFFQLIIKCTIFLYVYTNKHTYKLMHKNGYLFSYFLALFQSDDIIFVIVYYNEENCTSLTILVSATKSRKNGILICLPGSTEHL